MRIKDRRTFWLGTLILSLSTSLPLRPLLSAQEANSTQPAQINDGGRSEGMEFTEFASRTTELGKPKVQKNQTGKREFDIRLTDPAMSKKWDLELTNSFKAWSGGVGARGSKQVIVAVIDTGVDVRHPDLQNNLWVNAGETGIDSKGRDKATNGEDDDRNGFVDDVHGYNFVLNNNDLKDSHGHGTHIAGIIGAEGGNGIGISGVSPQVSLMILKYYDPASSGRNNLKNTVRAIDYAVKNKAQIINYSGGGLQPSSEEKAAIERARRAGVLFVAAAGNERSNSDVHHYYPANYGLDNIISVTAIDQEKSVLATSNYGVHSVDIAAPGHNIFSTLPGGKYGHMTGTSQATAFVSGVAALIKAKYPQFAAAQVIRHVLVNGTEDDRLNNKTRLRKRLNTYRALANLDSGVAVNGIISQNTHNLRRESFASLNPTLAFYDDSSDFSSAAALIAGKAIRDFIKTPKPNLAVPGTPANAP